MARAAHETNDGVQIGPFVVCTESTEMTEFAAALGLAPGVTPLTFPIRWLALPPVRAAMEDLIGPNPVHASQSFDFDAALSADRDYTLQVSLRRHEKPSPRLVVRGTVSEPDGRSIVRFETVLLPTVAIAKVSAASATEAGAGSLPDIGIGPIDQTQAARYAAAAHDDSRLHADPEFTRSLGLDGPIIHGMLMMGLFQRALSEWPVDSTVARLFVLFARPVPTGSRLVIGGRLVAPTKAKCAERQIVRLLLRTERNDVACIGEAMLVSRRPASP